MNYKHGHARAGQHSRVYDIWRDMLKRCNPETKGSRRHGKRGIMVCDRWKDFSSFCADVGEPPSDIHSLGRINNDGHYEPQNCRWETAKEQANNRSNSQLVEMGGRRMTVAQAAESMGVGYHRAYYLLITKPHFERRA